MSSDTKDPSGGAPPPYPGGPAPYPPAQGQTPYPPASQAPYPAAQQPWPAAQQPYAQPTGTVYAVQQPQPVGTTTVVVAGRGTCPNCSVGNLVEEFTCCGIVLAIFFFPIGLLCCLLMRHRVCTHCHAVF